MVQSPRRRCASSPASPVTCLNLNGDRRGCLRSLLMLPRKLQILVVGLFLCVLLLLVGGQYGEDRSKRLLDEAELGDELLQQPNHDQLHRDDGVARHVEGRDRQQQQPISSRALTTWRPRYPWRAFFIAINLFNNAAVIPHLSEALSAFLRDEVAPYFDIAERVFISIFANGSEDTTAEDILSVLVPALQKAGVPAAKMHIEVDGACCGGLRKRPKTMDRIHWMACVRNAAMAPLYDQGLRLFQSSSHSDTDVARRKAAEAAEDAWIPPATAVTGDSNRTQQVVAAPPVASDEVVVLFFNDILFQRADITTLLETNYARSERLRTAVRSGKAAMEHVDAGAWHDASDGAERAHSALWDGFNMACGMDFYTSFYDQWVTRGVDGRPFDAWPPYAQDRTTQSIFAASNRLGAVTDAQHRHIAAPVRCCWNGVAAIRASMFLDHKIRFREPGSTMFNMSRTQADCYSSECMLICKDIVEAVCRGSDDDRDDHRPPEVVGEAIGPTPNCNHESGRVGIFVNPHVQVAYDEASFALHRQHWFVSSSWFFRVVAFARIGSWMLPDTFQTPRKAMAKAGVEADDPLWMECVLPQDTLPLLSAHPWLCLMLGLVGGGVVLSSCVLRWCPASAAAGVVRRQTATAAALLFRRWGVPSSSLIKRQTVAVPEDVGTAAGGGGGADNVSVVVVGTPTMPGGISRRFAAVRSEGTTLAGGPHSIV